MHVAPDQINFVNYHATVPIDWNRKFAVKTSLRNGGAAAITATFTVGMVNKHDPKDSSSRALAFPFLISPNQVGEAILKPVGPIYWLWFLPVTSIPIGPYDKLYDF
jgi:hypothetical protein